jgi:hypothetical protein
MPRGAPRKIDVNRLRELVAAGEGSASISVALGVSKSTISRTCDALHIKKPVRFYRGQPARRDRAKR